MEREISPALFSRLVFLVLALLSGSVSAQSDIKFYSKEKVKTENNLKGVKRGDTWTIPPQYNSIEEHEGRLYCTRGDVTDIYMASYGQSKIVSDIPASQVGFYKSFYTALKQSNSYYTPVYQNGKWGFISDKGDKTEPKYDSLFVICMEGSSDNYGKVSCGSLVGVFTNGQRGAITTGWPVWEVPPGDYSSIRFYYNSTKKDFEDKFEVICTHKSGVKVVFIEYKKTDYAEATGDNNLKGYMYKGKLVAPVYKEIKYCGLEVADYECTLPDGKIEYRKGTELVPESDVKAYKERKERQQVEIKKEREQRETKEAELKAKNAEAIRLLIETKRDSLANELFAVYLSNDKKMFEKVNALNEYLKTTMIQNAKGEFDRSQWPGRSMEIRNNFCKSARTEITAYEDRLRQYDFVAGKIDLYDGMNTYIKSAKSFVSSCESWADFISTKGGDYEETDEMLGILEKNLKGLNASYESLKVLATKYKQKK